MPVNLGSQCLLDGSLHIQVLFECVQFRDVTFQRRDRCGGAFGKCGDQIFKVHAHRKLSPHGPPRMRCGAAQVRVVCLPYSSASLVTGFR